MPELARAAAGFATELWQGYPRHRSVQYRAAVEGSEVPMGLRVHLGDCHQLAQLLLEGMRRLERTSKII